MLSTEQKFAALIKIFVPQGNGEPQPQLVSIIGPTLCWNQLLARGSGQCIHSASRQTRAVSAHTEKYLLKCRVATTDAAGANSTAERLIASRCNRFAMQRPQSSTVFRPVTGATRTACQRHGQCCPVPELGAEPVTQVLFREWMRVYSCKPKWVAADMACLTPSWMTFCQKNVRNPNHHYFSKKYRNTPPICIAICGCLQFVPQCCWCPYSLRKGKYCQYSSHLYRSTPPTCIAIRLPFVSQYFLENLGGCGHRNVSHSGLPMA